MKAIVLIPARAGSTRVKNKNIRELAGIPLIGHVISAALKCGFSKVVVSTDSAEIQGIARRFGAEAPFLRPESLSGATASSLWVIVHALKWFRDHEGFAPDIVAFCPPTNPFLRSDTLKRMGEILSDRPEVNSIVTITRARTHPFRVVTKREDGVLEVGAAAIKGKSILEIERSQDWPAVWEGSPACRMTRARYFEPMLDSDIHTLSGKTYDVRNSLGFEIGQNEAFDIDDEEDWSAAVALAESMPRK